MKIVHISTVHDPFDTRIFEKMCTSAVDAGYDVTLIAVHHKAEVVAGIKIVPIRRRTSRLKRATLGVCEAISAARRIDADIYHIHDPELLLGIRALRRGKIVYDMHENMAESIRHKVWIPLRLRPFVAYMWSKLERVLLYRLPVIYAEHSYACDYPWIRRAEIVLNMPKNQSMVQLRESTRVSRKVAYVGTVTAARGSLVTVQAIKLLKDQNIDVEFLCIGPASKAHTAELNEYVRRYQLENVEFTGRIRAQEAWKLVSECQIGLATILPLPNYINSYPTKLFEYLAMGLPVITSNFPLYREIVEEYDCGVCVDPESPEEVAGAIRMLLQDPERAREMGTRGQVAVDENFSWEQEAGKMLKFYDRIMQGRRGLAEVK